LPFQYVVVKQSNRFNSFLIDVCHIKVGIPHLSITDAMNSISIVNSVSARQLTDPDLETACSVDEK
jgi:hypothetical protein